METMTAPSASDACKSGEIAKGQKVQRQVPAFLGALKVIPRAAKYHLLSCFILAMPSDTARTNRVIPATFMH